MAYIGEDEARSILETYHPRIRAVVERAWEECRKVAAFKAASGIGPLLYRRTLSNDVFDAIARHALGEFGSDPLVSVKVEAQTIKLFFKGKILARFKRGSGNKLGRNVATQSVMAFIQPDEKLPGLPPETAKLEFIWMSNEIQTQFEHLFVVQRAGNRVLWDYEIDRAAGAAGGVVIPFPPTNPSPDGDDDDLVKPRTTDVPKTTEQ